MPISEQSRENILFVDCFAGIAGDMFLSSLVDLSDGEDHLKTFEYNKDGKVSLTKQRLDDGKYRKTTWHGADPERSREAKRKNRYPAIRAYRSPECE